MYGQFNASGAHTMRVNVTIEFHDNVEVDDHVIDVLCDHIASITFAQPHSGAHVHVVKDVVVNDENGGDANEGRRSSHNGEWIASGWVDSRENG